MAFSSTHSKTATIEPVEPLSEPLFFFDGTTKPPVKTEGFEERSTLIVAGARYTQRCPVEFGVAMEVMIAA